MRKLTQLEKVGLVAAVVVAMSYFYVKKIYDPQAKALEHTTRELTKIGQELKSLQGVEPAFQLEGKLNQKKKELQALEESLASMVQTTESLAELNALKHRIMELADQCRLHIVSVTPKGFLREIFEWRVYWVEMNGSYAHFIAFLEGLRDLPVLVQVGRIEMTGEKDGRSIHVAMELKL